MFGTKLQLSSRRSETFFAIGVVLETATPFPMRKALLSLVAAMACSLSYAQHYTTALGIRGDWSNLDVAYGDINVKHFLNGTPNAIEATLGFGRRHLWLQGMYERNYAIGSSVEWYWGVGGDVGYWSKNYNYREDGKANAGVWTGIDGAIGIEYTFPMFPVNVALDAGPTVRMYPYVEVGPMVGFSIRYAFGHK